MSIYSVVSNENKVEIIPPSKPVTNSRSALPDIPGATFIADLKRDCQHNIREVLMHAEPFRGRLAYDIHDDAPVFRSDEGWQSMNENLIAWMETELNLLGFDPAERTIKSAFRSAAQDKPFNSFLEQFHGVEWDGIDRVSHFGNRYLNLERTHEGTKHGEYVNKVIELNLLAADSDLIRPGVPT